MWVLFVSFFFFFFHSCFSPLFFVMLLLLLLAISYTHCTLTLDALYKYFYLYLIFFRLDSLTRHKLNIRLHSDKVRLIDFEKGVWFGYWNFLVGHLTKKKWILNFNFNQSNYFVLRYRQVCVGDEREWHSPSLRVSPRSQYGRAENHIAAVRCIPSRDLFSLLPKDDDDVLLLPWPFLSIEFKQKKEMYDEESEESKEI